MIRSFGPREIQYDALDVDAKRNRQNPVEVFPFNNIGWIHLMKAYTNDSLVQHKNCGKHKIF